MSVNNEAILRRGLKEFRKQQYDLLERKLVGYCGKLLNEAVEARLDSSISGKGHNFTGNLINSIVVGLFREGNLVMFVTPSDAGQEIERPVRKKMTYPFKYYFSENKKKSKYGLDWDQTHPSSYYEPELKTNLSYGNADAKRFIRTYPVNKKVVFQIVVGYTTEYASFVEAKRGTTGYLQMVQWVNMSIEQAIQ